MNNDEKLIVMRGFGTALVKEAGAWNTFVPGAKMLAGTASQAFKTGVGAAPGNFSAATGALSKTTVGVKNVAAHIGRNKASYGMGAAGATGLGLGKAIYDDNK